MANVLLIESCNFKDYPIGGQLFFARQVMQTYGNRLALVGISTDDTPVGHWIKKEIDGSNYQFFAIGRRRSDRKKPLIPERIRSSIQLWRYRKKILSLNIQNIFIQAPELLIVATKWKNCNICYQFPGVENPLLMPRYKWGKPLAGIFDQRLLRSLHKTDTILACADQNAISNLLTKRFPSFPRDKIVQFFTRVDTNFFCPSDMHEARKRLHLPLNKTVLVTTGRINGVKGWDFLLNSFEIFQQKEPDSILIFVGDGEDRLTLKNRIESSRLDKQIIITGFQSPRKVAEYLNAADVTLVGSYKEGWSIAMLESLACGNPIVSTQVSGANDMIVQNKNGFIVENRDSTQFAHAISKALELHDSLNISRNIAKRYSLQTMQADLGAIWEPLK
jgi:glycosyltransferase involved in cell wall biosynthesis